MTFQVKSCEAAFCEKNNIETRGLRGTLPAVEIFFQKNKARRATCLTH